MYITTSNCHTMYCLSMYSIIITDVQKKKLLSKKFVQKWNGNNVITNVHYCPKPWFYFYHKLLSRCFYIHLFVYTRKYWACLSYHPPKNSSMFHQHFSKNISCKIHRISESSIEPKHKVAWNIPKYIAKKKD